MIRRKFILLLGSLIVLLLVGGVIAILLLHSVLEDMIHITDAVIEESQQINQLVSDNRVLELQLLVSKLRTSGLIVGIGFLLLLNISMVVLLRAAEMILKPISQLVDASRKLAHEGFDYRVHVDQSDEFGELAQAFNSLAEHLETNENRKVETLKQVARTLSHELNNAISTIDLQLTSLERHSGDKESLEGPLKHIHDTLRRMSNTVGALHKVRRVVLTDYLSGVKMLDLERSVADDPPVDSLPAEKMTEIKE